MPSPVSTDDLHYAIEVQKQALRHSILLQAEKQTMTAMHAR